MLARLLCAVLLLWAAVVLTPAQAFAPPPAVDARAVRADGSVPVSALPPQAHAVLGAIRQGGPFPHARDGTVFGNRERLLPVRPRGWYTEYTVPTPGARDRGARRLVVGGEPARLQEVWFTEDHYASFRRVRD